MVARTSRKPGRPPGKKGDPAWKQYSVLLKRETHRAAADMLRGTEQDLSDLMQKLLDAWVNRRNR